MRRGYCNWIAIIAYLFSMGSAGRANQSLPIPSNGVYLGIWANPSLANNQEGAVEIREGPAPNGINRTFALHLVYYQWGDIAAQLDSNGVFQPDSDLQGDITHGRVPVISWKCDQSGTNTDHVIAAGSAAEDAVITATAKALAQYPGPVLLRWFWEFNLLQSGNASGNSFCLGNSSGNPPTQQIYDDFIGAWQHIWQIFQDAGATNVAFLWNPGSYSADGDPSDPHGYYPGNQYVDWIGVDTYQRSVTEDFVADLNPFYNDFSQSQYNGKPMMVGENGSANYSQYNMELQSTYLAGVLTDIQTNRFPLLKAYDYFDSGSPQSWVLDDNNGKGNGGLAEMAVLGASPSFSPAAANNSSTFYPSPDGTTVYDSANNIFWLANANLAAANQFGLPLCNGVNTGVKICVNPSGTMNYNAAAAWVAAMNASNYLGHSNWLIPTSPLVDNSCGKVGPNGGSFGFGCSASAYSSLYNNLGLKSPATAVPIPANTVGPFTNIQPYLYWSQTNAGGVAGYYTFSFGDGYQGANTPPNFLYALPMVPGKIAGTPAASGTSLQVNPGGQTVYDPMTNVTWLANANLALTNTFGLPRCTGPVTPTLCVAQDGAMSWDTATQFVANMNAAAYLGQTTWQLPPIDSSCPAYNCAANSNPMGNLFYNQLGFVAGASVVQAPDIAVGPFMNIQPYLYWSCQGDTIQSACSATGPAPNFEWSYSFGSGFQGTDLLANDLYVTAYYPGPAASTSFSLSPSELLFSSFETVGTLAPAAQTVGVTVNGSTASSWLASADQPWVTLTQNATTFTVAVNPAGLAAGPHTSTISVVLPGATNNPQTVAVTLNVSATFTAPAPAPARFIPITPCRIADTRNADGPFGGPTLAGNTSRDFVIPFSGCGIPPTATAYSLNVAVVPQGPLGYLTLWPTGQPQPLVATLNSDGRVKSNAAIVPSGANGAVSAFVTNPSDIVIDINGYFVPSTNSSGLEFFPVTPCRIADTRNATGPLGGPSLMKQASRTFPILSSACGLPAAAQAYSLNFAAVPKGPLGYLTAWPTGLSQPTVASLNAPTGAVVANAVIVPSGTSGSIDVYSTDATDLVIDVNGYFAPAGTGGLALYTSAPCRVLDSRLPAGTPPFSVTKTVDVISSPCAVPAAAKAYVFNATVVPPAPLGYITMWPQGETQPQVATLNASDGAITSNLAIVPTTNGSISVFPSNPTQLVLDLFGYFAP